MKQSLLAATFVTAFICGITSTNESVIGISKSNASIPGFLKQHLSGSEAETTRYSYAPVRLSDNGREVIVFLTGWGWCGTGGCTVLLLEQSGSSYKLIGKIPAVHLPVKVLPTKTNGWHDITIWEQGGGINPGYTAILKFNGKRYSHSPPYAMLPQGLGKVGSTIPLNEVGQRLD
jgi:hypothetical protein